LSYDDNQAAFDERKHLNITPKKIVVVAVWKEP
jgi:hypothetical protein